MNDALRNLAIPTIKQLARQARVLSGKVTQASKDALFKTVYESLNGFGKARDPFGVELTQSELALIILDAGPGLWLGDEAYAPKVLGVRVGVSRAFNLDSR